MSTVYGNAENIRLRALRLLGQGDLNGVEEVLCGWKPDARIVSDELERQINQQRDDLPLELEIEVDGETLECDAEVPLLVSTTEGQMRLISVEKLGPRLKRQVQLRYTFAR